jgi:hypothetical protein
MSEVEDRTTGEKVDIKAGGSPRRLRFLGTSIRLTSATPSHYTTTVSR